MLINWNYYKYNRYDYPKSIQVVYDKGRDNDATLRSKLVSAYRKTGADLSKLMRYVSRLLSEAKVDDITKLAGKPIKVTMDEFNSLKSWRILTEVL